MGGNFAGGLALGGAAQQGGVTLLKGAPTLLKGAGEGAAYGALQGFGSGEGGLEDRLVSAGKGGAIGGVLGGAIGKVQQALMNRVLTKNAPSLEDIAAASKAAYQKAEDAGVVLSKDGLKDLVKGIKEEVKDFGYLPSLHPRVAATMKEMGGVFKNDTTLKDADVLRRVANNARMSPDPSEAALGGKIVGTLDDYLANVTPDQVVMGDAEAGVKALQEARGLYSRMRKSTLIDDAQKAAELRAAATGSGGNVDNLTRQRIASILLDKTKSKGFTAAEKKALDTVVRGTPAQNIARLVGKLSPSGNGLMAALGGGMTVAKPEFGVPAMAAGFIAKRLADGATARNLGIADALIRNGGDLPVKSMSPAVKAVLDVLIQQSGMSVPKLVPAPLK